MTFRLWRCFSNTGAVCVVHNYLVVGKSLKNSHIQSMATTREYGNRTNNQRWKNMQTLQTRLCYIFLLLCYFLAPLYERCSSDVDGL